VRRKNVFHADSNSNNARGRCKFADWGIKYFPNIPRELPDDDDREDFELIAKAVRELNQAGLPTEVLRKIDTLRGCFERIYGREIGAYKRDR
jgi:hypothetical protein